MAIETTCPHCGKKFRIKNDNAVGRKAPCPGCAQTFVIQPTAAAPFSGEPISDSSASDGLNDLAQAAASEQKAAANPYAQPVARPAISAPATAQPLQKKIIKSAGQSNSLLFKVGKWVIGFILAIVFITVVRVTVRLTVLYSTDRAKYNQAIDDLKSYLPGSKPKRETPSVWTEPGMAPRPAAPAKPSPQPFVEALPIEPILLPNNTVTDQAFLSRLGSTPENEARLAAIASQWKTAGGEDLLSTLKPKNGQMEAGALIIPRRQKFMSSESFKPPVTFKAVVMNDATDLRFRYAADQIIFNWELRKDEFRIDGGPASGRHTRGAGRLPGNMWVGIEWVVRPDEMIIYVDGEERFRTQADFSGINKPLTIWSHNGVSALKELTVVRSK